MSYQTSYNTAGTRIMSSNSTRESLSGSFGICLNITGICQIAKTWSRRTASISNTNNTSNTELSNNLTAIAAVCDCAGSMNPANNAACGRSKAHFHLPGNIAAFVIPISGNISTILQIVHIGPICNADNTTDLIKSFDRSGIGAIVHR